MTEPGRMRIAFSSVPMFDYPIHAECITAMEDAARLCEELGHIVEERTPDYDRSALADAWLSIVAANEAADLVEGPIVVGRAPRRDELEPWTWLLSEFGAKKTASDVILALRTMHWEGRRIGFFFEDFDILLTPTLGKPPVAVGRISTATNDFGAFLDELMSFIPFTPLANAVGVPSASLPLYWNAEGLPIGVMLTGRFGDEASILRLSRQLETARPWNQRHPPIWD